MKKTLLLIVMLAGCGEISVPVTGEIGGNLAQGQATAKMTGAGTFEVSTLDGLTCTGVYDALETAPTINAPTTCNDGRTGRLIITRSMNGLSGTVIGRLNDGTEARFVFGDVAFTQTTGDLATATR